MAKIALAGHLRGFFRRQHRRIVVFLAALVSACLPLPVQAIDFKICNGCHRGVLEEMLRPYLHVPFLQQRCGECHIAQDLPAAREKIAPTVPARSKISWLGEGVMADSLHGFVLPGAKVGNTLMVEVREGGGLVSRKMIPAPPLHGLAEVENPSGTPPIISGLQVLEVKRGVFLSATVGWQTDTLADAQVRYGTGELSQTAKSGNRFGRRHEVVLYDLKPDQTYRFTAVSQDLFGRSRNSEPMSFSTSKPLSVSPPVAALSPLGGEEAGVVASFSRIGADYLVELTLGKPGSVFVGSREVPPTPAAPAASDAPTGGNDRHHAGLSSKRAVSLDVCGSCHRKSATATHPVNVLPKPGMVIPPEYPTLPDGRITCRTCHETHSSDHAYLAVKGGRRELCVGCHKDML